jgi:hypothetical protein
MCSAHRPEAGADSIEVERPFRALVETYEGDRFYLNVRAIGPKGASSTAWQTAIDRQIDIAAVLRVEEVNAA